MVRARVSVSSEDLLQFVLSVSERPVGIRCCCFLNFFPVRILMDSTMSFTPSCFPSPVPYLVFQMVRQYGEAVGQRSGFFAVT